MACGPEWTAPTSPAGRRVVCGPLDRKGLVGVLAGEHPAPAGPRLSNRREGAEVRGGADLV